MSHRIQQISNALVAHNDCANEYVPSNKQSKFSGGTADILPAERQKASFNIKKLIILLDGDEKINKKKNFIRSPLLKNDFSYKYNMSRTEYFKNHVKFFVDVHKKFANYSHSDRRDFAWMAEVAQWNGGLMNAHGIYLGCVLSLGTPEQIEAYVRKAVKFEMVGCYAQTELGHGSNVRGLQTTATFDKNTQEFIMDTPNLQSIKWWPGALGIVATHACVFAQLIIDNKEYGLHTFAVQLRDENHKHLPGIETGDLGPKLGDAGNDTGYLIMDKVRIPRHCMLAKYSEVTPEGKYIKKGEVDKKAHYSTMMFARIHIIHVSFSRLAQAATIATRYSCVRKQGFKDTSEDVSYLSEEYQIIDYKMQKYRIFKQMSIAYAIKVTANWMFNFAVNLEGGQIGQINVSTNLKEIAAISAGIKGLCTIIAADGIEDLRKCCGGNGYLLNSGIGQISVDNLLYVTAEGDFSLMLLLTSKYLIKTLQKIITTGHKEKGVLEYLNAVLDKDFKQKIDKTAPVASSAKEFFNLQYLLDLFKYRALKKISVTAKKLQNKIMNEGMSIDEAANFCQIDLRKSSEFNSFYILMLNFIDFIHSIKNEPAIVAVMTKVCALFGCSNIIDGDWNGMLRHDQFELVQDAIDQLLNEIRPDCVALVDSFDFPDMALNSTIGSYDGNVYERLIKAARSSELNRKIPFEGYEEFLQPHLDKEFLKKRGQL